MNAFMPSSYNLFVVAASFVIAMLASYVTLDLARRVRTAQRRVGLAWWAAGSIVMGTGIWSMHFIGMVAYSLPVRVSYDIALTAISLIAAIGISGLALYLAGRGGAKFNLKGWAAGSGRRTRAWMPLR